MGAKPKMYKQRGDALLAALIGMLLATVLGLGLCYGTARVIVAQKNLSIQNIVLTQMVNTITTSGINSMCSGSVSVSQIVVKTKSITLSPPNCTIVPITVINPVPALSVTLPSGVVTSMIFSTPASDTSSIALLGGNGIFAIAQ